MKIDLRSDTVTKPNKGMLEAMMQAKVGDDVFNEDPTVLALEQKLAAMFGMDVGLFCPSGTMTNQIAIKILTQPQDEVICAECSHIYNYEGGGMAANSHVSVKLLNGDRGRFTAEEVRKSIRPDDIHAPITSLIAIENTVNKGGGCYYDLKAIKAIAKVCKENNLKFHLDGARFFNAIAETGESPKDYGKYFDTISICLSKGLGAPIGSILLMNKSLYKKAKRVRKMFGGGMRQVGYLAAAGIYALDNNIKRLTEDHKKARALGDCLSQLSFVEKVLPVDTNIVIFTLTDNINPTAFLQKLSNNNIKAVPFGGQDIRFVTHLDFTDEMLERTIGVLEEIWVG